MSCVTPIWNEYNYYIKKKHHLAQEGIFKMSFCIKYAFFHTFPDFLHIYIIQMSSN